MMVLARPCHVTLLLLILAGTLRGGASVADEKPEDNDFVIEEEGEKKSDAAAADAPAAAARETFGIRVPFSDDEDYETDGSGSGNGHATDGTTPGAHYPKFYRVLVTFTSISYSPFLADRNSRDFRELAAKIASAVENLYVNVPGRQLVKVISFRRGAGTSTVTVTVDLGTEEYFDRDTLYNTLREAVSFGRIGQYSVNSDSFHFEDLGKFL